MENSTSADLNSTVDLTVMDSLKRASTMLIGPNIASREWTPEMVWNTGFVEEYKDNLAALSVEQYVSFLFQGDIFSYPDLRDIQVSVKQLLCSDRKGCQHLFPGDLLEFPEPHVWGQHCQTIFEFCENRARCRETIVNDRNQLRFLWRIPGSERQFRRSVMVSRLWITNGIQ